MTTKEIIDDEAIIGMHTEWDTLRGAQDEIYAWAEANGFKLAGMDGPAGQPGIMVFAFLNRQLTKKYFVQAEESHDGRWVISWDVSTEEE